MDREQLGPALRRLKSEGANILLVSSDQEPGAGRGEAVACERLLGADDADRRRLHLFVDPDAAQARRRTGGTSPLAHDTDRNPDPNRVGVVGVQHDDDRTGTPTDRPATPGDGPAVPDDSPAWYTAIASDTSLARVACLANTHLRRLTADDPPAGSVRLCVSGLGDLLAAHDPLAGARFLHVLTRRVKVSGAMAHYHVASRDDVVVVPPAADLFDAVVETRERPGGPQQRWSLTDEGVETAWLPL